MGEMADLALEHLADQIWSESLQCYYDGFDNIMVEEEGLGGVYGPRIRSGPKTKNCRVCGMSGLKWGKHTTGWRLFHNGKLHSCY